MTTVYVKNHAVSQMQGLLAELSVLLKFRLLLWSSLCSGRHFVSYSFFAHFHYISSKRGLFEVVEKMMGVLLLLRVHNILWSTRRSEWCLHNLPSICTTMRGFGPPLINCKYNSVEMHSFNHAKNSAQHYFDQILMKRLLIISGEKYLIITE